MSSQQPAAICILKTPADAILILEATRLGIIPRVTRRLTGQERQLIRAGTVWVWEEAETNMKRWTDGRKWGASRVGGGGFLVYAEDKDNHGPELLYKQTYTSTLEQQGVVKRFHVVAYSSQINPQGDPHNPLPLPHQLPVLSNIQIPSGVWPEWEVRREEARREEIQRKRYNPYPQVRPQTATRSPDSVGPPSMDYATSSHSHLTSQPPQSPHYPPADTYQYYDQPQYPGWDSRDYAHDQSQFRYHPSHGPPPPPPDTRHMPPPMHRADREVAHPMVGYTAPPPPPSDYQNPFPRAYQQAPAPQPHRLAPPAIQTQGINSNAPENQPAKSPKMSISSSLLNPGGANAGLTLPPLRMTMEDDGSRSGVNSPGGLAAKASPRTSEQGNIDGSASREDSRQLSELGKRISL